MNAGFVARCATHSTFTIEPAGSRTPLTYIGQDAFLDGYDDAGKREAGSRELLEALAKERQRRAA